MLGRELARELALCDLDARLDDGLLDCGPLGDLGDVQLFERQLLNTAATSTYFGPAFEASKPARLLKSAFDAGE